MKLNEDILYYTNNYMYMQETNVTAKEFFRMVKDGLPFFSIFVQF